MALLVIMLVVVSIMLIGLGLLIGYVGFTMAIQRGKEIDFSDSDSLQGTVWGHYYNEISSGMKWINKQKRETVYIQSFDGLRLCGRLTKNPNAKGVALLFHGYKTHPEIDFSVDSKEYFNSGYHLIHIDQRASGMSQGRYIGFGVLESKDCIKWCQYACERFGGDTPIVLAGLSMGGATVLRAIGEDLPKNVKGIIADSAFSSPAKVVQNTIKRNYKVSGRLVTRLINIWAKNLAGYSLYAPDINLLIESNQIPIFLIHGRKDKIVPVEMTLKAYETNPGPKELLICEEAGHGTSYLIDTEKYRGMLLDFLKQVILASE